MKAAATNLNIAEPPEPTPWCTILALVIGHCLGDCQMTHFQLYLDLVQPDPTVTDITNFKVVKFPQPSTCLPEMAL